MADKIKKKINGDPALYDIGAEIVPDSICGQNTAGEDIPDKLYSRIINAVENTGIAAEISSSVAALSGGAVPAAHMFTDNYGENTTQERIGEKYDIDGIIAGLNKPIQIVLDGKIIGETAMKFEQQYKRMTRS